MFQIEYWFPIRFSDIFFLCIFLNPLLEKLVAVMSNSNCLQFQQTMRDNILFIKELNQLQSLICEMFLHWYSYLKVSTFYTIHCQNTLNNSLQDFHTVWILFENLLHCAKVELWNWAKNDLHKLGNEVFSHATIHLALFSPSLFVYYSNNRVWYLYKSIKKLWILQFFKSLF